MDERVFKYEAGKPIPEWDLKHRLPINRAVSPDCKDTATIFRVNSTFLDVTDQPYMERQELCLAVLISCFGVGAMTWLGQFIYFEPAAPIGYAIAMWSLIIGSVGGFGYWAFRLGRDEFFSLTRRPIRFNRKEQKIYTIRRRRFFAKPGEGDVTWEAPWNEQSIFCIHKCSGSLAEPYHIWHYTVDDKRNVVRAFAIGRGWDGDENLEGLLSQWNYWCEYMNKGPVDLPPPPLFFSEHENMRESFLFCLYDLGFTASSIFRIIFMPFVLLHTCARLLGQWTSREPIWPAAVEAVSVVAHDDAYAQPRGATPVGWGPTALARERGSWPLDPRRKMVDWQGEADAEKNALLWAKFKPPSTIARQTGVPT